MDDLKINNFSGTGKTTTLAAAVLSCVSNNDTCLVVAPSHVACDAVTCAITDHWPGGGHVSGQVVRLANKLRLTMRHVEQYLPENVSRCQELHNLDHQLRWTRSQLLENYSHRGDTLEEEEMLVNKYRNVYIEHEDEVIKKAKVVVCTLLTAMKSSILRLIRRKHFSVVCVDEAGFCGDSQLLPVILHADRVIMAGDHLQLPPVVLSNGARVKGLDVSLMERIAGTCPPETVSLLTTQYRSHEVISGWSSLHFYGGQLTAHPDNADLAIGQVPPLLWLDTAGEGEGWAEDAEDESVSNVGEAVVVADLVNKMVSQGVEQGHIGVISPYWAQVALIR